MWKHHSHPHTYVDLLLVAICENSGRLMPHAWLCWLCRIVPLCCARPSPSTPWPKGKRRFCCDFVRDIHATQPHIPHTPVHRYQPLFRQECLRIWPIFNSRNRRPPPRHSGGRSLAPCQHSSKQLVVPHAARLKGGPPPFRLPFRNILTGYLYQLVTTRAAWQAPNHGGINVLESQRWPIGAWLDAAPRTQLGCRCLHAMKNHNQPPFLRASPSHGALPHVNVVLSPGLPITAGHPNHARDVSCLVSNKHDGQQTRSLPAADAIPGLTPSLCHRVPFLLVMHALTAPQLRVGPAE